MSKPKKKRAVELNGPLFIVLVLALASQLLTFHRFRCYKNDVDENNKNSLRLLQEQHKKALDELKQVVQFVGSRPSSSPSVVTNHLSTSGFSGLSSQGKDDISFRSLPSGLRICRSGDWCLTDETFFYRLGDVSPVGTITNICSALVYTDLGIYTFINSRSEVRINDK